MKHTGEPDCPACAEILRRHEQLIEDLGNLVHKALTDEGPKVSIEEVATALVALSLSLLSVKGIPDENMQPAMAALVKECLDSRRERETARANMH